MGLSSELRCVDLGNCLSPQSGQNMGQIQFCCCNHCAVLYICIIIIINIIF